MQEKSFRPYIVADIEGTSGVWKREDTMAGTPGWCRARVEMTHDVSAAVDTLFSCGASSVMVKDFHRDGFNIVPRLLDRRAVLVSGYYLKPLVMYGNLRRSNRAFFIGMHAASGNRNGFLSHTLTSRITRLSINGNDVCETQIFAHVLGEVRVPVVFVSGCPEACREAREHLPWIVTCPVPKVGSYQAMTDYASLVRDHLRETIAEAAALKNPQLYRLIPPYEVKITFRDEKTAMRSRWNYPIEGSTVRFHAEYSEDLIFSLIRIAYFSPLTWSLLPWLLPPVQWLRGIGDRLF
ncbi:MAG: M55 family metallopeptidase [Candidatus Eremiobacteraeota bacterium]|nr:M55 family metallopeptidase [Candidatus Eremiobacteraeota bacterium]